MRRKLKLEELKRVDIKTYREQSKYPITVMVDNIRSGMNIGSIFRTCDAMAVEKVIICGISPTPPHKEINKTAIGSTESVRWEYVKDPIEKISKFKEEGYEILAIEQTNDSVMLDKYEFRKKKKYVLIFGNEVSGVDEKIIKVADSCLEVPQFGTKHSLNVAVCAGIVLWEFMKNIEN